MAEAEWTLTYGSPTARKYSRKLSFDKPNSIFSLFSSGASKKTVINCFFLAYLPPLPKNTECPFGHSVFFCAWVGGLRLSVGATQALYLILTFSERRGIIELTKFCNSTGCWNEYKRCFKSVGLDIINFIMEWQTHEKAYICFRITHNNFFYNLMW